MVRGDKFIKGHPEMGLVSQQIYNILGELFCPFYFILGTFFKKPKNKPWTTIFFYPFVLDIISVVSPMHWLQEIPSLPSKHTQPKTNTLFSFQMVFKFNQGQNTRKSWHTYAQIHTYIISAYKLEIISLAPPPPHTHSTYMNMTHIHVSVL